jgi:hypothetical protein
MWCDAPSPTRFTELARERLKRDVEMMIRRDYNHPSIVIWSPYNESWGLEFRSDKAIQEWMIVIYDQIKAWDPTRLVVDNSGWRHVKTDIADSHKYTSDRAEWRGFNILLANDPMTIEVLGHPFFAGRYKYDGEPIMLSEYGVGWGGERPYEFKWQTDEIRRHANIVGYTYTELYDIEHELAGFATYERRPKFVDYDPAIINSEDFIGMDYRGEPRLVAGAALEIPVFVSLYGQPAFTEGTVQWKLVTVAPTPTTLLEGSFAAQFESYTVTTVEALKLTVPQETERVRLWLELRDASGVVRAQNFLVFDIIKL